MKSYVRNTINLSCAKILLTSVTGSLREDDMHFFLIISRSVLLRMRLVPEEIKTHILYSVSPSPGIRTVYEIMRNNIVELGRPQVTIWRMRIACWIAKATLFRCIIPLCL